MGFKEIKALLCCNERFSIFSFNVGMLGVGSSDVWGKLRTKENDCERRGFHLGGMLKEMSGLLYV